MQAQPAPGVAVAFNGTIVRLHAGNVGMINPDERTALIHVDEVVSSSSPLMKGLGGHEITMELAAGSTWKAGDKALFLARPWMFGENVALVEVSHRGTGEKLAPVELPENRHLVERLTDAGEVVIGSVRSLRPPTLVERSAAQVHSEHDAMWRVAEVTVERVLKGSPMETATVLFPTSNDVVWYDVPRLTVGERAILLLHTFRSNERGIAPPLTFRLGDKEDVQAAEKLDAVSALLPAVRR